MPQIRHSSWKKSWCWAEWNRYPHAPLLLFLLTELYFLLFIVLMLLTCIEFPVKITVIIFQSITPFCSYIFHFPFQHTLVLHSPFNSPCWFSHCLPNNQENFETRSCACEVLVVPSHSVPYCHGIFCCGRHSYRQLWIPRARN